MDPKLCLAGYGSAPREKKVRFESEPLKKSYIIYHWSNNIEKKKYQWLQILEGLNPYQTLLIRIRISVNPYPTKVLGFASVLTWIWSEAGRAETRDSDSRATRETALLINTAM